ncbi:hypothetical protein DRP04_02840 [Archaeoglobales archaeon]|nr:MAG: hypothetical protein DRP04_02840 [Archaeoglobales archaeon]
MLILATLVGFYLGVFMGLLNYYANKYYHERAKIAVRAGIAGASFAIFLNLCEIVLRFGLTTKIVEFYLVFVTCMVTPFAVSLIYSRKA